MSYTITFDASHKVNVKGGHVAMFLHHIARDVDERNGVPREHANENIDSLRTLHNVTMVNDGSGGFARARDFGQIDAYLQQRLATVKRKLRKDAVILRPFILQLDPKWFDDNAPDWKTTGDIGDEGRRFQAAALDWVCETFGQHRIVATSLHLDEDSPQLQVIFTPATDDGRLSQKDFFTGPPALRAMHTDLREHMAGAGYDVEFARTARSKERLSSQEFAAKADRVRDKEAAAQARQLELDRRNGVLTEYDLHLDDRETELRKVEYALPALRQGAVEEGRRQGRDEIEEAISDSNVLRRLLREALASAEEYRSAMRQALSAVRALALTAAERNRIDDLVRKANDEKQSHVSSIYERFPELREASGKPEVEAARHHPEYGG
jgi:flagellar biosynthesis/type III secretory pathway protein FliH